jgi:TolA-binding protein
MVSLEQIKLLESKVTKTIDYVKKVTEEKQQLKEKLDSYQKRIDELEVLILQFKQDQNEIEDGILSALDRLNKFEDALESKLSIENKPITESKPAFDGKLAETTQDQDSPPEPNEDKSSESGELDIF